MVDSSYYAVADSVARWVTAGGIVVGGCWAWYRFGVTRQSQAAISAMLSCKSRPHGGSGLYLSAMCATIKNTGTVKLEVRRRRAPAYPRDSEDSETLKYGGDLLLRRVPDEIARGTPVRWFASPSSRSPLEGDIELDLLSSYEKDGETSFWMEPGETYYLGTAVVLPGGLYLAMLTILGEDDDDDFWRSEFVLAVPETAVGESVLTPQETG